MFIFRGISTVNNQLILAGAIPAALIALGADFGLGLIEKQLTEKTAVNPRFNRRLAIALSIVTAIIISAITFSFQSTAQTIIIGSKNFTEQVILGELLAQQIETQTRQFKR